MSEKFVLGTFCDGNDLYVEILGGVVRKYRRIKKFVEYSQTEAEKYLGDEIVEIVMTLLTEEVQMYASERYDYILRETIANFSSNLSDWLISEVEDYSKYADEFVHDIVEADSEGIAKIAQECTWQVFEKGLSQMTRENWMTRCQYSAVSNILTNSVDGTVETIYQKVKHLKPRGKN